MSQKEKQILDINEIVAEIREAYNKAQEKIEYLKSTNYKEATDKFSQEAASILEVLNQADQDLLNKTLKEIETIKNDMLIQFDKASNLQHDLERLYTKESVMRQLGEEGLEEMPSFSHKLLSQSIDLEGHFGKPKSTLNQENSQKESKKGNSDRTEDHATSPGVSGSERQVYQTAGNSFDDGCSFEDYKAYRNKLKTKKASRDLQATRSVQSRRSQVHPVLGTEISDYEPPTSKTSKRHNITNILTKDERNSSIEKMWNLQHTFGKIGSPQRNGSTIDAYVDHPFFFKNSTELLEFLEEYRSVKNNRDYLWQYIFHLQERLQTDAQHYERKLNELREELAYKDRTIAQIIKKQEKADINTQAKYYENLKLVYNPRKMISMLKNARQTKIQEEYHNENVASNLNRSKGLSRKDLEMSPRSLYASNSKRLLGNLDFPKSAKGPLTNISINQSFDYQNGDANFSFKRPRPQLEALYSSTSGSYATLNTLPGDEEMGFSTPSTMRAYVSNLNETLKAMKENSMLVQSENYKLKEYVKLLRNKVAFLERENDKMQLERTMTMTSQQSSAYRSIQQVPESSIFRLASPKGYLDFELTKKLKRSANTPYHYSRSSMSHASQIEGSEFR